MVSSLASLMTFSLLVSFCWTTWIWISLTTGAEGLLEQQTGLNPTEIMTDTAGSSDLIFGLFWLLGYQFSPRLADAGASVFWRVDKDADYGVLNDIPPQCC